MAFDEAGFNFGLMLCKINHKPDKTHNKIIVHIVLLEDGRLMCYSLYVQYYSYFCSSPLENM